MAYELRLSGTAQQQLREYIEKFGEDNPESLAHGIRQGLKELAEDPDLGTGIARTVGGLYRINTPPGM